MIATAYYKQLRQHLLALHTFLGLMVDEMQKDAGPLGVEQRIIC